MRYLSPLVAAAVLVFLSAPAAIAAPIGTKAVYVEGTVTVFSVVDKKTHPVKVGTEFAEGDEVTTAAASELEIEFDTGDLIRLDENTELVIKSLNRNEAGSTSSVFGMALGRVKAAVSKLADEESRFELHTKTAICGVAGTPPFVVEAKDDQTNVDLLGEPGAPGKVYVQGATGPGQKVVFLTALTRTIVRMGEDPLEPFPVTPERLRQLKKLLRFEFEKLTGRAPTPDEEMMMESLARRLSLPRPADPSNPDTLEDLERQYDQGRVFEDGGVAGPEQSITRGKIKINLK
ncbi:MAG: FecR family protein [Candidatus Nitrospinota bacterium M3_3B_026]